MAVASSYSDIEKGIRRIAIKFGYVKIIIFSCRLRKNSKGNLINFKFLFIKEGPVPYLLLSCVILRSACCGFLWIIVFRNRSNYLQIRFPDPLISPNTKNHGPQAEIYPCYTSSICMWKFIYMSCHTHKCVTWTGSFLSRCVISKKIMNFLKIHCEFYIREVTSIQGFILLHTTNKL